MVVKLRICRNLVKIVPKLKCSVVYEFFGELEASSDWRTAESEIVG